MHPPVYIALIHYPVLNKRGDVVTTSITNFDLHDLGRTAKTYGVLSYFIVTPNLAQQNMARFIRDHWSEGPGGEYNPSRKQAVELMKMTTDLAETRLTIQNIHGNPAKLVATSARKSKNNISFNRLREELRGSKNPYLILFGTGWGLTDEVLAEADAVLEPIKGSPDYNHLPVRSAVAIVLDRLLGEW